MVTLAKRLLALGTVCCTALLIEVGAVGASESPEKPITEACFGPITDGGVDLCGTLNPNSSAKVGYHFAYNEGSSCTGGEQTAGGSAEGEDVAVSEELTGLEPDTLYSYCLVATNDFGEAAGGTISFEFHLPAAPPQQPITEACAEPDLGGNAWLLCGTLNPELPSSGPVAYYFAYDTDGDCAGGWQTPLGSSQVGESVAVSAEVTGLVPQTVYSYCLVAVNDYGETYGGALTFETPAVSGVEDEQSSIPAPITVSPLVTDPALAPAADTQLEAARRRFLKRMKACARKPTRKRRARCRKRARVGYERARAT